MSGSASAQTPSRSKAALDTNFQAQMAVVLREKASRTPAMRKMDQNLIYAVRTAKGEDVRQGLPKLKFENVVRRDGTVDVEMGAKVNPSLLNGLTLLGGQTYGVYPRFNSLNVRLPVRSLESATMLPGVRNLRTPGKWMTHAGSVQTEGDVSVQGDLLRSVFGLTGAGTSVGVISDSDDHGEDSIGTGDLPGYGYVDGQTGRPGTGEGTAMMEVAYDLAPSADLGFLTGKGGEAAMAQAYLDLFGYGRTVLVDDFQYVDEPAFQDGPVAQAITSIVNQGGIVFSAVGNHGNLRSGTSNTWEGDWNQAPGDPVDYGYGARPYHDFGGTAVNGLQGDGGQLRLQWNDPWGAATNDYDLVLVDSSFNVVGVSAVDNPNSGIPLEALDGQDGLRAIVYKYAGDPRVIRLQYFGGSLELRTGGTSVGHAVSAYTIGVGAVDAAKNPQRAFNAGDRVTAGSADGPRRIYFDANGLQIAPDLTLAGALTYYGPSVVGPSAVSTSVPAYSTFFGTSASAAHAAGVAALLKEFAPDATFNDLLDALAIGATDIMVPGADFDTGYGAISGLGAVKALMEAKTKGISPSTAMIYGNNSVQVTLDLGRPAPPAGLTLDLYGDGDTGEFHTDSPLYVPAGASTIQFTFYPADATTTTSAIADYYEHTTGAFLGKVTLYKYPAIAIRSLGLNPTDLVGGARNSVGTVTLTQAPGSPFYFDIQSSAPSVASVPASAGVGSTGTTKTFTITTHPVAVDTDVTIRVRKQGTTDPWQEQTLHVRAPKPNSCVPSPTSGVAGTSVTFTVKLDGPAPNGGLTVGLVTTDASIIAVPRTLTFQPGESQKSFTTTAGSSQVKKVVTVSVRYKSQTLAQGKFLFVVPEVASLGVNPNPVQGGSNATGTVTLASPAGPGGVLVTIGKYGTGFTAPATVVVSAGATSKTFPITTVAVGAKKTVKVYAKTSAVTKTVVLTIVP